MKKYLLVLLTLLSVDALAQQLYDHTPNARVAAMGGAGVANSADAFAAFGNAASALMEYKTVQVAFAYTDFSGEVYRKNRMLSGGGYIRFAQRHTLVVGLQFNMEPRIEALDRRPGAQRFDLGYGYKVSDRVAVAATARYRRTYGHLFDDNNYNGGGADIAVYSQLPLSFMEGAKVNLGAKLAFDAPVCPEYDRYGIAPAVGAGLSLPFTDGHKLDITTELRYGVSSREDIFSAKVGAEYSLMRLLYVRAGGKVSRLIGAMNDQTLGYGTIGAGVRFFHLQFDIAYLFGKRNTPLNNAVQISVGLDF
ncbi:MAG: PorV/PorQ family protein [Rikenellaceae bacterium]|nr:PorV/PorQ family protein [Rikenellaceae bacterium]